MSDVQTPAIPEPQPPLPQSTLQAPIAAAFVCLLFWQIAPRIRAESFIAFLISSVLYMILVVWFAASLGRALYSPRAIILSGIIAAAIAVPFRLMIGLRVPAGLWLYTAVPGLSDLLLVWLAGSIGSGLSLLLKGANMIPPVAAVLALVDIWTVLLGGPVHQIMTSDNPAARAATQAMTVQLPAPRATGAAPSPLLVGFADFLFIAFFIAAICRFAPNGQAYKKTVTALLIVLSAYLLLVASPIDFPVGLPALVPTAVVMIAINWRHFHYDRSEAFALLYAGVFIALIAIAFWYLGRTPPKSPEQPMARIHRIPGHTFATPVS